MTRLEAGAVLLVFAVIGALGLWLGLSRLWGRRRIPPRLEPVSMAQIAAEQNQLNRLLEKRRRLTEEVIEPAERRWSALVTDRGRLELARRGQAAIYFPPRPTDWLSEDPDSLFDWPEPPATRRPYDQHNPRPWAHA